jgi:hypothetical protein
MPEPCKLRAPRWAFALLGVAMLFLLGFVCAVWAVSGFAWSSNAARALAFPSAVGAGLAAGAVFARIRRMSFVTRREAIVRGAIGFGAVGFAWPASFVVADLTQGVVALPDALLPLLSGAAIGSIAGALAAGAASVLCLTCAAAPLSPEPPPG